MKSLLKNILILFSLLFLMDLQSQSASIVVDLSRTVGEMSPIWANFGYDEPNNTYTVNGKKLLRQISELGAKEVFIRNPQLAYNQRSRRRTRPEVGLYGCLHRR